MRGISSDPEPGVQGEPARVCADCHRSKTVRGVWYLVPGRVGASPFVCEGCYGHSSPARAHWSETA